MINCKVHGRLLYNVLLTGKLQNGMEIVSTGVYTLEERRHTCSAQRSLVSPKQQVYGTNMGDLSVAEDTLKRISSHKGILGSVIINGDGIPIRCAACLICLGRR